MTATEGSAGYVAQEVVDATLDDRTGSFVLQHVDHYEFAYDFTD